MRILLVNQFYPPDMAPTGQHLHDLARCLVARGHDVTALCSRRSYDGGGKYAAGEVLDGVAVRRLPALGFGRRGAARAADYLSFHLAALVGAGHDRPFDLSLCLTTPPYVGWTVTHALGVRAARRAHWVMDLYPDVVAAHGGLSASGPLYRFLGRLTRRQLSGAALVLALGPHMRERVAPYVSPPTRLEWMPLWGTVSPADVDPAAVAACRAQRGWAASDCVLLYSGNMGLGHRLSEFLEAARRLGVDGPVWAFAGGGQRRAEVERFVAAHRPACVQLLPYVAQEHLAASLAAADVHLVSLRREWQGLIVPSKLQAAFALGRPVVFVGPRENEAAAWILESGGGWLVGEDRVDDLLAAVREASDPAVRAERGARARAFARERFSPEANTARIADLVEAAAAG
jgi:glycosyltransferase involved in cell wall biosynthesis